MIRLFSCESVETLVVFPQRLVSVDATLLLLHCFLFASVSESYFVSLLCQITLLSYNSSTLESYWSSQLPSALGRTFFIKALVGCRSASVLIGLVGCGQDTRSCEIVIAILRQEPPRAASSFQQFPEEGLVASLILTLLSSRHLFPCSSVSRSL